mmetsp:Transcript_880/g.2193  ORF Transcript_880/g.2193 Transcript_880/m.2193 type:complete len:342 (+) Transcript_880:2165-3190(+)
MATGGGHEQGSDVAVYTKDFCRQGFYLPGLGPFGLLGLTSAPGIRLTGHSRSVGSLVFSERFLVTGCQDNTVKIWHCSDWECVHTIRDFDSVPFDLATLGDHIFATSNKGHFHSYGVSAAEKKAWMKAPDPPIQMWTASPSVETSVETSVKPGADDDGTRPAIRHVANLYAARPRGNNDVGVWYHYPALQTVASRRLLISAHLGGHYHFWHITGAGSAVHVGAFEALAQSSSLSISSTDRWAYLANSSQLLALDLSAISTGTATPSTASHTERTEVLSAQPGKAEVLNCFACGLFKPESSKRCGQCSAVRFCDASCLKAGWKRHKASCRKKTGAKPRKNGA